MLMTRRVRIAVPGIPWHIIQRGHNRNACVFDKQDYRGYLDTLSDMSTRFSADFSQRIPNWCTIAYMLNVPTTGGKKKMVLEIIT